ncbi:MAG: ParB/RepB/Spo0J family partition protein [Endomicrobiaceae bacterium]|jgi:ParB family chromosome partitioning protein|nr:ParB/RepB/Spo0J family partition protein [Endomicrobiaceae bacterium]
MSKQKLGRGLEAILSPLTANKQSTPASEHVIKIAIDKIKPNRHQPRLNFNEEKLQELADSIKQNGLLEPVLVIQSIAPGEYELIAGERRLRASKLAGLKEIKAIVKTSASDKDKLDIALIENIQREDLNPIEEAMAYKKYAEDYKYTQEQISHIVNKNRSVIANTMRLLNLPNNIQNMIINGTISSGHGRMLASITDENKLQELVKQIIEQGLTVRDIENIVAVSKSNSKPNKIEKPKDIEISNLIEELQRTFGTKVEITGNGKKGKIIFNYSNLSDLERISNIFKK